MLTRLVRGGRAAKRSLGGCRHHHFRPEKIDNQQSLNRSAEVGLLQRFKLLCSKNSLVQAEPCIYLGTKVLRAVAATEECGDYRAVPGGGLHLYVPVQPPNDLMCVLLADGNSIVKTKRSSLAHILPVPYTI